MHIFLPRMRIQSRTWRRLLSPLFKGINYSVWTQLGFVLTFTWGTATTAAPLKQQQHTPKQKPEGEKETGTQRACSSVCSEHVRQELQSRCRSCPLLSTVAPVRTESWAAQHPVKGKTNLPGEAALLQQGELRRINQCTSLRFIPPVLRIINRRS